MTGPVNDARTVAAAELHELAVSACFYAEEIARYLAHGDVTGVKRSKLMVENAVLRMRVAWTIFDEINNGGTSSE